MIDPPSLLLLDHRRPFRDSWTRELIKQGVDVLPLWHFRQALEAVRCRRFDFAVLHVPLPGIDEQDLAQRLSMQNDSLRVIVIDDETIAQYVEPNETCDVTFLSAHEGIAGLLELLEEKEDDLTYGSLADAATP